MNNILDKIEASFKASLNGEEALKIVMYRWGLLAWLVAYFILDTLVKKVDLRAFDIAISIIAVIYFVWHIYITKKCAPKKPKLSKEEKRRIKMEGRKDFNKKVMRKLLLQESVRKWDPAFVTMVVDLFCIAHFVGYIF